jgi:hypothetical protein
MIFQPSRLHGNHSGANWATTREPGMGFTVDGAASDVPASSAIEPRALVGPGHAPHAAEGQGG